MNHTPTAVVIGASSGIGRELARQLAAEGYRVGITGRRESLLSELAATAPERFETACIDLTAVDCEMQLAALVERLTDVALIVICSGTGDLNPELDYTIEAHTNRVNVEGFTRIADWSFRYFTSRGRGHLAAVSSIMGLRGSGIAPAYAASKAYQIVYLEGLRQRAVKAGLPIAITDLRPGSVDTAMMKGEGHFWISTPEKAATYILRAIRRRKSVAYISPRWQLIGTLLKLLPRGLYKRM